MHYCTCLKLRLCHLNFMIRVTAHIDRIFGSFWGKKASERLRIFTIVKLNLLTLFPWYRVHEVLIIFCSTIIGQSIVRCIRPRFILCGHWLDLLVGLMFVMLMHMSTTLHLLTSTRHFKVTLLERFWPIVVIGGGDCEVAWALRVLTGINVCRLHRLSGMSWNI